MPAHSRSPQPLQAPAWAASTVQVQSRRTRQAPDRQLWGSRPARCQSQGGGRDQAGHGPYRCQPEKLSRGPGAEESWGCRELGPDSYISWRKGLPRGRGPPTQVCFLSCRQPAAHLLPCWPGLSCLLRKGRLSRGQERRYYAGEGRGPGEPWGLGSQTALGSQRDSPRENPTLSPPCSLSQET